MDELKEVSLTLIVGGVTVASVWFLYKMYASFPLFKEIGPKTFQMPWLVTTHKDTDSPFSKERIVYVLLVASALITTGILVECTSKEVVSQRDVHRTPWFRALSGTSLYFLDTDKSNRLRSFYEVSEFETDVRGTKATHIKATPRGIFKKVMSQLNGNCKVRNTSAI